MGKCSRAETHREEEDVRLHSHSNSPTLAFVHTEIHMQNACRSVSFISSLSVRICTLSS